jgi:hypothetical protein
VLGGGAITTFGRALALVFAFPFATAWCEKPSPHGLSHDQIEQTIKDRGGALKSCWKANGPHGELKLRVAITIQPDGRVASADADSKDGAVNTCVEKQIRGWTFAKAADATKFSLPVNLKR